MVPPPGMGPTGLNGGTWGSSGPDVHLSQGGVLQSGFCTIVLTSAALERPADLFDREREWAELSAFVSDGTPGLRIAIVYGRRRQGGSYPLRRLAAATGGFYYQALEHEPAQALAEFGDLLGAHRDVGRLAFANWDEAISSLGRLAPRTSEALGAAPLGMTPLGGAPTFGGAAVAIIDEFPYLLKEDT